MLTRRDGELVIRIFQRLAVDATHFRRDELLPFAEAVCKPGRAKAMVDWYRAALRAYPRNDGGYHAITIPTLLIWAMQDKVLGYEDVVPGIERYVHQLDIQRIESCGHFVQQERPEEVSGRLIRFLKST
jgi:pimeloyl-ACP methyl ester carboxylesterase